MTDNNKRKLCARRKRKRNANIIEKLDKIEEILSEFDNLEPDLQISSVQPWSVLALFEIDYKNNKFK